jgi:hypothetical protein
MATESLIAAGVKRDRQQSRTQGEGIGTRPPTRPIGKHISTRRILSTKSEGDQGSPPKQKRAPAKSALRKLRLKTADHIADFDAKLLEKLYWFWESRRGRLADLLENEKRNAR